MRWINILLPAAVVLASATMTVAWAEGMDEDALVRSGRMSEMPLSRN